MTNKELLEDLLVEFDELGMEPTTIVPNPSERAIRWKRELMSAIERREAEMAREIFDKIRNILNKHYYACYQNKDGDERDAVTSYLSYVAVDFDKIEQKYTGAEPEPPKGE